MKSYEAMFILKQDLSSDTLEKAVKQIQDLIEKNKGAVDQAKEWGRQKLAYPVKKCKEGIYYLFNFHITPDSVSVIKKAFYLNESILRVLITVM